MAPTSKPKPIPETYRRVTPCLVVQGGAKALEFYAEVFGATERMRFPGPDGTVAHAELQIGDSVVIVEDESRSGVPRRAARWRPPAVKRQPGSGSELGWPWRRPVRAPAPPGGCEACSGAAGPTRRARPG
jgi:hypothetical protein